VPAYPGRPNAHRTGDVAGTLWLLAYLAAAIALMVLDHRGGWLRQLRSQGEVAMQPVWWIAGLPGRIGDSARGTARTHASLTEENRMLRNALLVSGARVARLQSAEDENQRIRALLGAAQRGSLDVQLVPILDIDLDPTRQRLVLDGGSRDGVRLGQPVIDAGGVLGQIISVTPTTSVALLLTDPDHALPVEVARSGVRLVVYGNGRSDQLSLVNVPLSGDVKVGDSIVTSGLGTRFPAGFAVGTITALRPDDSRAFLVGEVEPAARLNRGRDVLLLREGAAALRPGIAKAGADGGASTDAAGGPDAAPGAAQAADPARAPSERPAPPTAIGAEAFERAAPAPAAASSALEATP
jgi:rod shape-determining protein MreC